MLRSADALIGYGIQALDDILGRSHDFLFDDHEWVIRYLVVDTRDWLPGRKVLIATRELGQPDWSTRLFPVNLKREQVENSPKLDLDKPISRQDERDIHEHYGWAYYWQPAYMGEVGFPPQTMGPMGEPVGSHFARPAPSGENISPDNEPRPTREEPQPKEGPDPNLRSFREVEGYRIQASDGEIGHVADVIFDDEDFAIRYLVVDTRNWLPGRKVLVSPVWIFDINWSEHDVFTDLPRETIKHSPEYDPTTPVNRDYEEKLYDYYGRPAYWK